MNGGHYNPHYDYVMKENRKFVTLHITFTLFQVSNYMNGCHHKPHHDYVMKEKFIP